MATAEQAGEELRSVPTERLAKIEERVDALETQNERLTQLVGQMYSVMTATAETATAATETAEAAAESAQEATDRVADVEATTDEVCDNVDDMCDEVNEMHNEVDDLREQATHTERVSQAAVALARTLDSRVRFNTSNIEGVREAAFTRINTLEAAVAPESVIDEADGCDYFSDVAERIADEGGLWSLVTSTMFESGVSVRTKVQRMASDTNRQFAVLRRQLNAIEQEVGIDVDEKLNEIQDKVTRVVKQGIAAVDPNAQQTGIRAEVLLQNLETTGRHTNDDLGPRHIIKTADARDTLRAVRNESLQSVEVKRIFTYIRDTLGADSDRRIDVTKKNGQNALVIHDL